MSEKKYTNFNKIIPNRNQRHNRNIDLCKKYFYKYSNNDPTKNNIFRLMENNLNSKDEFEQVDDICEKAITKRNDLEKLQLDCLKSMILNHKQIPEQWIIQSNYKNLLNKAMEDPIVLSYAIICKDIFKKRSTSCAIEEEEYQEYIKSSPSEPKFISYINPYSKNYCKKSINHQIMKNYCDQVKNKKPIQSVRKRKIKINEDEKSEIKQGNSCVFTAPNQYNKEILLPCIKNKNQNKEKENDKEEKDTLMMTSLHYDAKEFKDKNNNKENEDDSLNNKNNNKSLELPLIV